jgi:hypothetical protein
MLTCATLGVRYCINIARALAATDEYILSLRLLISVSTGTNALISLPCPLDDDNLLLPLLLLSSLLVLSSCGDVIAELDILCNLDGDVITVLPLPLPLPLAVGQ